MFLRAMGREPRQDEQTLLVKQVRHDRDLQIGESELWASIAHILFNTHEFVLLK